VEVTFTVPAQSLGRREGVAAAIGVNREEALWEAVRDWNVRREHSTNRGDRLEVEKALRAAKDLEPIEGLLERFRAQMQATSPSYHGGEASAAPALALAGRRKALGFSQQKLAGLAGCSIGIIRMLESGYMPNRSEMVGKIERALTAAEE
jgi:hypothetical protein